MASLIVDILFEEIILEIKIKSSITGIRD